jgi:hypothetical protein
MKGEREVTAELRDGLGIVADPGCDGEKKLARTLRREFV